MQSTGHSSTQARSFTSMQGSQIVYVTSDSPLFHRVDRGNIVYPSVEPPQPRGGPLLTALELDVGPPPTRSPGSTRRGRGRPPGSTAPGRPRPRGTPGTWPTPLPGRRPR